MVKADTDEHVRGACARSLGDLQDQTSLDLLEAALEDHPVVRFQAVLALGKIGNSAAGPSLLALLRDPLPEVRYQAVRALGHLKLEGSEVHLEPLLQDSDVMVRRGVEQTLQEFGMSVSQIRRMRILKAFSKAMLAISPSYIFAALPGKAGSAVAALTMFLLLGGVWLLSNVGTFVNGSSVLPVFRVENVRISSAADLAVVWRKELVFDVARATTGKLLARIQCSVGTREVIVENKGGVIVLAGKTLKRLRPEDEFEPSLGTSKDLGAIPLGISFHPRNNLCCLFMPNGQGTQLQLYNGETLETVASHDIKGRFDGRCLVSPDMKMGLSLNAKGELSIAELASGEVFSLNVSDLVKSDKIGKTRDVQFSTDMKHVCFSTTENLFIFSVNSMTLQKQIQEAGGFFATSSSEEGLLRAVSSEGKIVEISPDLSNVTEKDIGHYFNLVDVDPGGKLIIIADTDARDANVFDIQQQKIVSTIAGE